MTLQELIELNDFVYGVKKPKIVANKLTSDYNIEVCLARNYVYYFGRSGIIRACCEHYEKGAWLLLSVEIPVVDYLFAYDLLQYFYNIGGDNDETKYRNLCLDKFRVQIPSSAFDYNVEGYSVGDLVLNPRNGQYNHMQIEMYQSHNEYSIPSSGSLTSIYESINERYFILIYDNNIILS